MAVKKGVTFWDVLPEAQAAGNVPARTMTTLHNFRSMLVRYGDQITANPKQAADCVRRLMKEINYEAEIAKQYKEESQQELRKNILEEFINSIGQYVEKEAEPTLGGFLETTTLMDRDEQNDKDDQLSDNSVRLMTLHSAKGLEFPRVYLIGMEEGLLPHKRSIESGLEKDIAEERRLAYVGVTRAMDHLTLTRAASRMKWGKRREAVCSRFLFEMQKDPGTELQEERIGEESEKRSIVPAFTPLKPAANTPFVPQPRPQPSSNEFDAPPF